LASVLIFSTFVDSFAAGPGLSLSPSSLFIFSFAFCLLFVDSVIDPPPYSNPSDTYPLPHYPSP